MLKTYSGKPEDFEDRSWYLIDLEGQVLGRIATKIANLLRGKTKPGFTPHLDCGDFVVVVNASKVKLTGRKMDDKIYYHHTGYMGHLKSEPARELLKRKPEDVIHKAVWGMMPKTDLSKNIIKKLKIYAGPEHPHAAQQPRAIEL